MLIRPAVQPLGGDVFTHVRARRLTALGAALALCCGWTLVAAAAPASAAAQTRFVAVTGNDGAEPVNDCTVAAAPCRTVQHAVDEAAPADTVSVAAGTYAESVVIATSWVRAAPPSTRWRRARRGARPVPANSAATRARSRSAAGAMPAPWR